MDQNLQAQSLFDIMKLLDKDLIDKILALSKTIQVQELEGGITRITIDLLKKELVYLQK